MDPLPVLQKVYRRDRSARKRRRSGGEQADSESKRSIISSECVIFLSYLTGDSGKIIKTEGDSANPSVETPAK